MSFKKRRGKPFIWPSWITGLLAGDDHCQWSAWFKAHHTYDKVEDDGEALNRWKAEHDQMVTDLVKELTDEGLAVSVEGQNKFKVTGAAGIVSGVIDVVSEGKHISIWDCKSGREKDKDLWQVRLYLMMYPIFAKAKATAKDVYGYVVYKRRKQRVKLTTEDTQRIVNQLQITGGEHEPARTPSASECRFCNILDCPDRTDAELEGHAAGLF